jgi:cytochrome P450
MDDLLGMLLAARDEETGEGMSDTQLRDEVLTLFVAGHETTATTLAWAWSLLAAHPEVEQRLHAEVDTVLGGRTPTVADLPALSYTRMIVDETLRLYPAGWLFSRMPEADEEVDGYRIPAKSTVFISPYITHRHPDFWQNADTFDPQRFAPEQSESRPRYAYFPFGGGPRMCIGNNFALMEAHLIVAMIAQTYRLRLAPGAVVEPKAGVTLHPEGIQAILEPR